MTQSRKAAEGGTGRGSAGKGFTPEERAAMQDHVRELKAAAKRDPATARAEAEAEVRAKIGEMSGTDRAVAERLHALIGEHAPDLAPRLWYGMPAYAKDGKVLCFFQAAQKFKTRYATLGFSDQAKLDEGAMWPSAYALTELTPDVEERIVALLERAVG